jgi:hypothetical protein
MVAREKTPGMTSSRYSTLIASQMKTSHRRILFPASDRSPSAGRPKE